MLKDFEWILEVEQVCTRETSRAETAETAENASPSLDKMGDDVMVLLGRSCWVLGWKKRATTILLQSRFVTVSVSSKINGRLISRGYK